jgi:hypothetical protein
MLRVIMPSVVILFAVILNVIMLSVITPRNIIICVIILSALMLSIVILNVFKHVCYAESSFAY